MTDYDGVDVRKWRGQLDEVTTALESLTAALDSEDDVAVVLNSVCVPPGDPSGALNLFGSRAHGFDEIEEKLLGLHAAAVETALRSNARYLLFRELSQQLQNALSTRAVIDQAKGIVMASRGVTAEEAFTELVRHSQLENVKLDVVAEQFVAEAIAKARAADGRDVVSAASV